MTLNIIDSRRKKKHFHLLIKRFQLWNVHNVCSIAIFHFNLKQLNSETKNVHFIFKAWIQFLHNAFFHYGVSQDIYVTHLDNF